MAYMIDGKGPYPNKAGEHCGNHCKGSLPTRPLHETQDEARRRQEEWLATMRFGRPRSCETGTTEELEARGYVGLYLKEDSPPRDPISNAVDVPTPPELMELAP